MSEKTSDVTISHVNWREIHPRYLTPAPSAECLRPNGLRVLLLCQLNVNAGKRNTRKQHYVHFDYDYAIYKTIGYLKVRLFPIGDEELLQFVRSVVAELEGKRNVDEF